MSAATPKLRRHNGRWYRIEGCQIFLIPPAAATSGWVLRGFAGNQASWEWLKENGLAESHFPIRARALDAFLQSAQLRPLPSAALEEKVPALIPRGDGSYRSRCGKWQINKKVGGWEARREGLSMEVQGATLSALARTIERLEREARARRSRRESRSRA